MKILHLCWSLTNGGIENMLVDIINYQVKSCDLSLCIINSKVDYSILNRVDRRCNCKLLNREEGSKNLVYIFKLNKYIHSQKFDIVHLHNCNLIKYLWVKENYVRTVHNTNIDYHNYRWHKGIIAISEAVMLDLKKRNLDSVLINNGVNFNLIKKRPYRRAPKIFRIVQVSRIYFKQKGQDILLNAIAMLVKRGYRNIHLDFIGEGIDLEKLKLLVKDNNLESIVSLKGNCCRDYIYQHLCEYDLFVQPSRFEGFGLTVVEAMGACLPVLVSKNEGPLTIVENGKFGYTFNNMNVEDCANIIEKIISCYPSEEFIELSYKHALKNYSVDLTAQKYLDFYNKISSKQY